jgi:hypothetical protein
MRDLKMRTITSHQIPDILSANSASIPVKAHTNELPTSIGLEHSSEDPVFDFGFTSMNRLTQH